LNHSLYIFSGLGADERIFQKLDFKDYKPVYIQWLVPKKNESIASYALRLCDQISEKYPILLGVSFGGIVAIEVAKIIQVEKVIVLSSAKIKTEIPLYYRQIGKIRLHTLVPAQLLKHSNILSNWFFGTQTNDDRLLLKQIFSDTDTVFLKWAIDAIVRWKNTIIPNNVIHIHGTHDRILPIRYVKCNFQVHNGGHFMVYNESETMNGILNEVI